MKFIENLGEFMSFLDKFEKRYSVKKYVKNDKSKKIDQETLNQLKEILRLTPSSINSQPWKFVFVTDEQVKSKLASFSFFNQESIENCDCLVVFCVVDDILSFEKSLKVRVPERAISYYDQIVKPAGDKFIKSWFQKQVYLSLGVLLSACANMQIDSTPMEGIDIEKYNQLLNIKGYTALVVVTLGTRDLQDYNRLEVKPKSRCSKDEVIIEV